VLSPEADQLYTTWRNLFKRTHRLEGGQHHHISGFCRKLENKVLRWATLSHVFEDEMVREVSVESMEAAISLSEYALGHFEHVHQLVQGSSTSNLEKALRRHLFRKRGQEITLRQIGNGLPRFAKAPIEVREEALNNLAEDGVITRKTVKPEGGGRPSLRVVVL
jgi:hypothetical protein